MPALFDSVQQLEFNDNIFQHLPKLRKLRLSIGIFSLPFDIFKNLTFLEKLDLSYNNLITLPTNILATNIRLRHLSLANNAIIYLDEKIFVQLLNLQTLFLNDNKLATLHANLLMNTCRLSLLRLDENPFISLPSKLLWKSKDLQTIYLSIDQMRIIPPDLLMGLPKIQTLYLHDTKCNKVHLKVPNHMLFDQTNIPGLDFVKSVPNIYIVKANNYSSTKNVCDLP